MRIDLAAMTRRVRNPRRKVIPLRPIVAPAVRASDLYAAVYGPIIALWQGAVERILTEYERSLAQITTDSAADLQGIVGSVEAEGQSVIVGLRSRLTAWAAAIEAWQRRRWRSNVLSATGVDIGMLIGPGDVRGTLATVIERNVGLVRSVSDETRQKIADAVFRGLQERTPVRDVAKTIREAVDMGRRRALNIAADQTVKITASLNEERRRQAGIDAWEWVHSGKLHPREEHRARNGLLYSDDPADVGNEEGGKRVRTPPADRPGQLPWCGCTARAVLILA